jgi:hypothetical protein
MALARALVMGPRRGLDGLEVEVSEGHPVSQLGVVYVIYFTSTLHVHDQPTDC